MDETTFTLGGYHHRLINCRKGEQWKPNHLGHCKTHGEKVHAWGCFSYNGVGALELFHENLKKEKMLSILQNHLGPSIDRLGYSFNFFFILQDNDRKHRSVIVQEWLNNNHISQVEIPPYSPDLNPIENLISVWKSRVYQRCPTTMDELKLFIREEWEGIDKRIIENLVKSMPNRCKTILENDGHRVGY